MPMNFPTPTPTSNASKQPETNAAGTVTQWVPVPTAYPLQEGCANALLSARSGNLTGYDPGYAVTVDASVRCWPSEATTWWSQADPRTTISLGPVACPAAYYTAAVSEKDASSTLVACCPSGYAYQTGAAISIVAPVSQCISGISEGQVFELASDFGSDSGWQKTFATAIAPTFVLGIPFNGWQFKEPTTAVAAPTSLSAVPRSTSVSLSSPSPSETSSIALAIPNDALSPRAKLGIGLGVGIGVLMAIGILLWVFLDPLARMRHRRIADRVEAASRAQGRGRSPPLNSPTPPSLREIVLGSPTPASLGSPGWSEQDRLGIVSPLPPSEVLSLSSSGGGVATHPVAEPRDMTELPYHEDAAPAPVVGGMGVGRSGSAFSHRYNERGKERSGSAQSSRRVASSSRLHNAYSAQEWVVTPGQPQPLRHARSGSLQSLYAIGSYPSRRPSTAQSGASTARSGPAIGLWGIDPTGRGGRSDSVDTTGRNNSVAKGKEKSGSGARHHGRSDSTSSQTGPSGTATSGVGRSSSQRSARIVMSPIEMAGQRYDMALEIGN